MIDEFKRGNREGAMKPGHNTDLAMAMVIGLALMLGAGTAVPATETEKAMSVEEAAKELSNPAGSLSNIKNNIQFTTYKGDLPGAGSQDSWAYSLQPTLPFPVGNKGNRIIFRPLIPVSMNQPVFKAKKGKFEDADVNLRDITFDLVYAGNEMQDKSKGKGYLWGIGVAGTLPTATDSDLGGNQWRLGPELFGGILRKWGLAGGVVNNQWNVGGSNDDTFSKTTAQYFYAFSLGKGWQIASSPVITYDWKADSDEAWTVPLGFGVARTTKLAGETWKFQGQVEYYVEQPDTFGPDWLLKFTISPVIKNPFIK